MSNEFITTDADLIFEEVITTLEAGCSEPLYPGDERRIFGEAMVPLFVGMYNAMNDASRQKMLRYARGEVLDALGERIGVERLTPTEATTVLRFSLASAVDENVIIMEGTRATSDSTRYFATARSATIEAGNLYVDVDAVSVGGGTEYNDIAVGAINTIVDLIPFVDTVSNITVTSGGGDAEDDDNLRERIRVAPSKLTTAGPVNGYRYWAMSADPSIVDVSVTSSREYFKRTLEVNGNKAYMGGDLIVETLGIFGDGVVVEGIDYDVTYEDDLLTIELKEGGKLYGAASLVVDGYKGMEGCVTITPLCDGEKPAPTAVRKKVLDVCSASEVRPLTDKVIVKAPAQWFYDIELTYYTTEADESACIQTIEGEGGAIDQYVKWQQSKLGRHINPDKLRALILAPTWEGAVGATRVEITSPEFTKLDDTRVAWLGDVTIKHEVSE